MVLGSSNRRVRKWYRSGNQHLPAYMMKTVFMFVLFTMLAASETFGQEKGNVLETGTLLIQFERSGGYEGTPHGAIINSEDLQPDEAKKLHALVTDSNFFDLPSRISSNQRLCFDCYHYTVSIETPQRKHTVHIDTETAEVPAAFEPLLSWLAKEACKRPEFRTKC